MSKFLEQDAIGIVIHDKDLLGWPNQFIVEMGIENKFCFKIFIDKFKRNNKIVSMNITHIVQINKLRNHAQIVKSAQDFAEKINKK